MTYAKKGAVIHFYDFENESEVENGVKKIDNACNAAKKKYTILNIVKAGQHGPRAYRYCFDFKLD